MFEELGSCLVELDIVTMKDTYDFVKLIISKRGLDLNKTLVRVDPGGGFMKIYISVFHIDEKNQYMDTGVQKV